MASSIEKLVLEFPLLLPMNKDRTMYEGLLKIHGEEFKLLIELPPERTVSGASLCCCDKLSALLSDYKKVIEQRLRQSQTLPTFLEELRMLVYRLLRKRQSVTSTSSSRVVKLDFKGIVADLNEVGWNRVTAVNEHFDCVDVNVADRSGRGHTLQLRLSDKHPAEAPKCIVDLPEDFDLQWPSKGGSIANVVKQFEVALDLYQDFWNACEKLDGAAWILEPEKPTRAATRRRIALLDCASIQLDIRPRQSQTLPDIKLLGSDQVVLELRSKLHSRIHLWAEDCTLIDNLSAILDVKFPTRDTSRKEDFAVSCGICYAYRLELEVPDQRCTNSHCKQPFHQTCLYEWFRSMPTSRQSFSMMFGECPYCRSPLTVKMPLK